VLSRHPDDPEDAPGQTLAVAHLLAAAKPVVDLISDDDKDVKPVVKKEGGGDDSSSGRYGGGRRGGGGGRYGGGDGIRYYNILVFPNFCKIRSNLL
jgi:hypothetical protein